MEGMMLQSLPKDMILQPLIRVWRLGLRIEDVGLACQASPTFDARKRGLSLVVVYYGIV